MGDAWNSKYGDHAYVGQKFNYLTVLSIRKVTDGKSYNRWIWTCRCDCGTTKDMRGEYVVSGHSKTCGCGRRTDGAIKHNSIKTRLYQIWAGMKERCSDVKSADPRYYKRGIRVCDEWRDFRTFAKWANENGYEDHLSIERIDNDGDYCPENCKWIERPLQARNRGTTYWVEWKGEKLSLAEACELEKMPYKQVFARIKYCGWPVDKALTTPMQSEHHYSHRKGCRVYEAS